jgi:hypothetical protein
MIRKLKSCGYRLLFAQGQSENRQAPQSWHLQDARGGRRHERAVQYFKRH